jgi:hypothetical protein
VVDRSNYTVENGSTIITFTDAYVKTLPAEANIFTAEFANGNVEFVFVKDGSAANTWLIVGIVLLASLILCLSAVILHRKKGVAE